MRYLFGVALFLAACASLPAGEAIFAPDAKLKVEAAGGAGGEGPAWHPRLGVLTSGNGHIYRLDRQGKSRIYRKEGGTNGLLFDRKGRLLACEPQQRRITRTETDGKVTVLTDRFQGKRYNEPNDLTVDSRGRIYFSDPRYGPRAGKDIRDAQGRIVEGVYRIDTNNKVTQVIGRELERPNGLLVSPDDRFLYVADNNNNKVGGARKLWRFNLRKDGTVDLARRKLLFDWGRGRGPDGLKQDRKGRLYVAAGLNKPNPPFEPAKDRKGGIYVFSPEGKLLAFLPVPRDEVTNCAFGGDDRKTLYITAGGTLYSIRTTTPGRLVWPASTKAGPQDRNKTDVPRAADPRLQVELFAAAPDIVHPIGIAFDRKGRLLVIESHTHFRPANYQGPRYDRIRLLEDTRGNGKADRFTTFFEGTQATMDIAVHPDGSVYLTTRNEILRLRDTKGDGKADEKKRIVFLDTRGDYPHNGLSGLSFDSRGNLYFGIGENIGAAYKLVGSDGTTLTGGGEGGNVFWCTAEGKKLRRVATGFWNPFGTCRDVFGNLFAVDNDPDAMPPCRLVHVVEGGDYGFQFRYGRAGRHPFQAWNGELPGTLPMVSGTGEAPCKVLSYESDGLPRAYLGNLLVASWADHRVERYVLQEQGASFRSKARPFVQGGKDFRPVGVAVAPDGSLIVSDWVLASYTLHQRGAIWHIRRKKPGKADRPLDPRRSLFSAHRPLREAAARRLAADDKGRDFLSKQLTSADARVRAASLTALVNTGARNINLSALADKDPLVAIRVMAVRALVARGDDVKRFLSPRQPAAVQREAIGALKNKADVPGLLQLLTSKDPFLRHAAVEQLAHHGDLLMGIEVRLLADVRQRLGLLLAYRASGRAKAVRHVPEFLADADDDVRFLAAKWISDQRLVKYRPLLVKALKDRELNIRMYRAYSTALARVDNKEVNEAKLADYFFERLTDDRSSPALRVKALQLIPPTYSRLAIDFLNKLLHQSDPALRLEAARALSEHPNPKRRQVLLEAARNPRLGEAVRAQAILGLAEWSQELQSELLRFAEDDKGALRDEALRALVNTRLSADQRRQLAQVAKRRPGSADLVARVLGKPFARGRPAAADQKGWLKRLEGPADASAGRRIFFHPRLAGCFRCHRVEGRGQEVGPDLSTIGHTERRDMLESILQPSNLVAPYYQSWRIETSDGKVYTGMLVKTVLDEYTYLDAKGKLFKINTRTIVESSPSPVSIMPDGLADLLTDQEMRDLLAYLGSRR